MTSIPFLSLYHPPPSFYEAPPFSHPAHLHILTYLFPLPPTVAVHISIFAVSYRPPATPLSEHQVVGDMVAHNDADTKYHIYLNNTVTFITVIICLCLQLNDTEVMKDVGIKYSTTAQHGESIV